MDKKQEEREQISLIACWFVSVGLSFLTFCGTGSGEKVPGHLLSLAQTVSLSFQDSVFSPKASGQINR